VSPQRFLIRCKGKIHARFRSQPQIEAVDGLLQDAGVINARGRWIGGETHLVQVGDVPHRGPDTRKVMDLLMQLEKQASQAGGMVHALIGDHEAMNIYGDPRYVTAGEYDAFRNANSARVRDAYLAEHLKELEANLPEGTELEIDEAYIENWYDEHPLGWVEFWYENGRRGKYGKWVQGHNTVIRINDWLFLHGGISPKYADSTVRYINERVRAELADRSLLEGGIVTDGDGPLWYRGLALDDEADLADHVDAVLEQYGVSHVVVGHTVTAGAVIPRFDGKVVLIDVGMSAVYGSRLACLVIENGVPYALHRGEKLRLPSGSGQELLDYLTTAAALDPEPSPLIPLIDQISAPAEVATTP